MKEHFQVIDSGTFAALAERLSRDVQISYYSPFEQEYLGLERCCLGDGFDSFERVEEYMDPDHFNSVTRWVFPDLGFQGFQKYLRSLGKPVWGSFSAMDFEWSRTRFLKMVESIGLPIAPYTVIRGLDNLREHLKTVERKWVKINRYRDNAETWFHSDYEHSLGELDREAVEFGPLSNGIVYVVQDEIKGTDDSPVIEIGYDGWCIDGKFPKSSFAGFEAKNELYLGSLMDYDKLSDEVRGVNDAISSLLKEAGYRNFFATEIRVKDGVPYFIDITPRMAGQTQEHLLETCTNLTEVIRGGSEGELIVPEFSHQFAAEATMHYKTQNESEGWKTIRVPKESREWFKLYRCCYYDDAFQFPKGRNDELGVVIGLGDTIEESIDNLKENFESVKDEPVSIEVAGFADLLEQIKDAEKEGVEFSDQAVPKPEIALS